MANMPEWRTREDEFTQGVIRKMAELGCTPQDIHSVEYIGLFPHIHSLHRYFDISKDLSMLSARLDRIADVSTLYANRADAEPKLGKS